MEEELEQGSDSWNRESWKTPAVGKRGGVAKATRTSSEASQTIPSQIPPAPELFEPANRKRFLDHLVQIQFPALRDLAAKLLESGCFLLDPADLTMSIVERLVVEADEYNEKQPYWDWVRAHAAAAMHEAVMGGEEDDGETGDLDRNMVVGDAKLRRAFNQLPLERRRALYAVAVLGESVEEAASRLSMESSEIVRLAREALKQVYGAVKGEMDRIRDGRTLGHEERGETDGQR